MFQSGTPWVSEHMHVSEWDAVGERAYACFRVGRHGRACISMFQGRSHSGTRRSGTKESEERLLSTDVESRP